MRLQRQQQIVEILKNIVQRSWRIADSPRDFASRQSDQTIAFNNTLSGFENALP